MTTDIPMRPQNVRSTRKNLAADPTPSAQLISQTKKTASTTDDRGRVLVVKYLSTLDRMRIAKLLGGELAKNEVYLGYATLAYTVTEIDGDAVPPPATVREIEFLVDRLGDEGLTAVGKVYQEDFAELMGGIDLDQAKN
jgi:hypothetical protein